MRGERNVRTSSAAGHAVLNILSGFHERWFTYLWHL
jgi:hypothetical protein